jgi:hypothetical protein
MRNKFKLELLLIVVLSLILSCSSLIDIGSVEASSSYTGEAKPLEFYFHYIDSPVEVAGLETKYVMNTTRSFRYQTDQETYSNSFYKPVGLPKVEVDFYLHPNFAGPVTIDGLWQVFIWVNSSAYKPATFTIQFSEITTGGVNIWDSGQINPTVTSTIGDYIDVPVFNYNLSEPISHNFSPNTSLLVSIEVNTGSSADTRIWYDSPNFPSKVILPCRDYARPVAINTFDINYTVTDLFHYNWSKVQRNVIVQTNVTDPFGGYDVYQVNMTIIDPSNYSVLDKVEMSRISDGLWQLQYLNVFEANWSYPLTADLGNYTILISVIDNNGYYQKIDTGSFNPYIETNTHIFTIGELVYYNPTILVVDKEESPLPNSQVYITYPNGSRDILPRYTSTEGLINLTDILPSNYGFTILWKDTIVNQTTLYLESNDTYTIKTQVYQLTINVQDTNGASVKGAYVIIYKQTGLGYGLAVTNDAGQAVFKMPEGTYDVEVQYSKEYWLRIVSTSETEQVTINDSMSKTIKLTEFPPPVWSTTGFQILLAAIIVTALVIIYFLYRSGLISNIGRRKPQAVPRY